MSARKYFWYQKLDLLTVSGSDGQMDIQNDHEGVSAGVALWTIFRPSV